jgi:hypothetical protein
MTNGLSTPARRWLLAATAGIWCLWSVCAPVASEAGTGRTYAVPGTVIAVTLNQTPPLIVVDTLLSPKNHMTVGATVTPKTKILRGEKHVALQTIRVGETIWLSYVKGPEGLLARTIRVKG